VLRSEREIEVACKAKAEASGAAGEVSGLGGEAREEVARGDRRPDKIEKVGMRAELCRDLRTSRCLSQPGKPQAGVVIAHPEVPILVSVLDARQFRIFKRAGCKRGFAFSVQVCVNGRSGWRGNGSSGGGSTLRQDNCFHGVEEWGPGPKGCWLDSSGRTGAGAGAAGCERCTRGHAQILWGLSQNYSWRRYRASGPST